MAGSGTPRFDVATLQDMAGGKVFVRGKEYHADGQVEILAIDAGRVRARVYGSEAYRAELQGGGRDFSGECTCPAFEDWGFCKHLVAVALAANAADPGAEEQRKNQIERLRAHLASQGTEALVEMILRLADEDSALFRQIELAAAAEAEDDATLISRFEPAIDEATATPDYVEYAEARSWAAGVDAVVGRIETLVDCDRAKLALGLLDHLFARMEQAFESIDDSNGHARAAYARAMDVHLAACRKIRPDPVDLARALFARETQSSGDLFDGASAVYADVLGDSGLAEYRRLAHEAWAKLVPLRAEARRTHDEAFGLRFTLQGILERFAREDGDVDALIALQTKDLSTAHCYLRVAELCLAHGRETEALRWAEEGLWLFEKDSDRGLVFFVAGCYAKAGRKADAEALLWQTFERHPDLDIHARLKALAKGNCAAQDAVTDKAVAVLEARIAAAATSSQRWSYGAARPDMLVELLTKEKRLAAAWQAVRAHGCGDHALQALAQASEQAHPTEALAGYADLVERAIRLTLRQGYEQACRHIDHMRKIRDRLGDGTAHAAYVEDLLRRHKAKRTFVKLMQERPRGGRRASS